MLKKWGIELSHTLEDQSLVRYACLEGVCAISSSNNPGIRVVLHLSSLEKRMRFFRKLAASTSSQATPARAQVNQPITPRRR